MHMLRMSMKHYTIRTKHNENLSCLPVHQSLRNTNNGIDDRARCERDVNGNPGRQMARFDQIQMPFFFDGTKCFYELQPISERELEELPVVTLTDGDKPYEPFARLHSRRRPIVQEPQIDWKRCLGFIPDHVVKKTLLATTQLVPTVESETREIMRDHFQTRLPELKVCRINDTCFVNTFFSSSVPSVRGYACFKLFCFKRTGLDVLFLMHRRSQSPPTLARLITECGGAPTQLKSDNAPEQNKTKSGCHTWKMHFLQSEFLRKVSVRRPFPWYCFYADRSATNNDQRGAPPPLLSSSVHCHLSF